MRPLLPLQATLVTRLLPFMQCSYRYATSYSHYLKELQWPSLKNEMVHFFRKMGPSASSQASFAPLTLKAQPWPRFCTQEALRAAGFVPAAIWKHGPFQRVCFNMKDILAHAFEEEHGHISMLFTGRPIKVILDDIAVICVVSHIKVDPVEKYIYFVKLSRHVPGQVTDIEVPCTLIGMLACPAYLKGYQVELALPKVQCQVAGSIFPQPFQIDISKFNHKDPYAAIFLRDIQHLLPLDGSVRFHPKYVLRTQEVVWSYEAGTIQEERLPSDWIDPNFLNKHGKRIHLTYKGFWPKQ